MLVIFMNCFIEWLEHFILLLEMDEEYHFSSYLPLLVSEIFVCFNFRHSNWCVVKLSCVFNFIFLMVNDVEHLFTCLLDSVSFSVKYIFTAPIVVFFQLLKFENSLYTLAFNPLILCWFYKCFLGLLSFHFLNVIFMEHNKVWLRFILVLTVEVQLLEH